MIKLIYIMVFICTASTVGASSRVQFNHLGDVVKPDYEHIRLGLKEANKDRPDKAYQHYQAAAQSGNYYAISLIATHHLKKREYTEAMAWLKLINLNQSHQHATIKRTLDLLQQKLTTEQLSTANQRHQELIPMYGYEAGFNYRKQWRNGLKFTGSRIRGKVPDYLTIVTETNPGLLGTTMSITGHEVRTQLDEYVYEYDFDIPVGKVILEPIKLLESQ